MPLAVCALAFGWWTAKYVGDEAIADAPAVTPAVQVQPVLPTPAPAVLPEQPPKPAPVILTSWPALPTLESDTGPAALAQSRWPLLPGMVDSDLAIVTSSCPGGVCARPFGGAATVQRATARRAGPRVRGNGPLRKAARTVGNGVRRLFGGKRR